VSGSRVAAYFTEIGWVSVDRQRDEPLLASSVVDIGT
jgi:hypothetical protein